MSDRGIGRLLAAFYAVMYYGGLRPAEAVALRETDCRRPASGWGTVELTKSLPVTAKKWTDHGQRRDPRGLKQRDPDAVRPVPIPPWLVTTLQAHSAEFGTAPDGRLFRNERGGIIGSTTYSRVWAEARQLAFTPTRVKSRLASGPYDLRHAALKTLAQRRHTSGRGCQAGRELRRGRAAPLHRLPRQAGGGR